MLVDLTGRQVFCRTPSDCGMALGCFGEDGCGPCTRDRDCGPGEVCVLDHCVLAARAHCRSYRDCPADVHCILTGISPDPRGNAGMEALCGSDLRLPPDEGERVVPGPFGIQHPPRVSYDALLRSIREEEAR